MNKLVGENLQMSTSHQSSHTLLIEKYIKRMAATALGYLSEEAKTKLTRLGYPVSSTSKRRARQDYSDDEEEDHPPTHRRRH